MTFQEYCAVQGGLDPDAFVEALTLADNPAVVACVAALLERISERHRVDALVAKREWNAFESLGQWKAMQEARDFLINRTNDFNSLRAEYNRLYT